MRGIEVLLQVWPGQEDILLGVAPIAHNQLVELLRLVPRAIRAGH
jgi:hypothetical protein